MGILRVSRLSLYALRAGHRQAQPDQSGTREGYLPEAQTIARASSPRGRDYQPSHTVVWELMSMRSGTV